MISPSDLQGIDAAWLAVDAIGQVALFITGGEGHVPETAIASTEIAEEATLSLPETSDCNLLVTLVRPDNFIAFARRGLFAYDWSDVHRPISQSLGGYELQARPFRPLQLTELPAFMQDLAASTKLSDVTFGASIVVPTESAGT